MYLNMCMTITANLVRFVHYILHVLLHLLIINLIVIIDLLCMYKIDKCLQLCRKFYVRRFQMWNNANFEIEFLNVNFD